MNKKIRSPLSYPGGKTRACDFIFNPDHMPMKPITEIRETFLGGGSCSLRLAMMYPGTPVWVNDKYYNLYSFWMNLRDNHKDLIEKLDERKRWGGDSESRHRELFEEAKTTLLAAENNEDLDQFERAWRFYLLNKCSFSGLGEQSTMSSLNWHSKFSVNSILKLVEYHDIIKDWKITNLDYSEILEGTTDSTFIFLDPPYDIKADNLYGQSGEMHKGFDHVLFAERVNKSPGMKMITYNSNPIIQNLFEGWFQLIWDLDYSMNNGKVGYMMDKSNRKELLCMSYGLKESPFDLRDIL